MPFFIMKYVEIPDRDERIPDTRILPVAEFLLEKETITGEEFMDIIKKDG